MLEGKVAVVTGSAKRTGLAAGSRHFGYLVFFRALDFFYFRLAPPPQKQLRAAPKKPRFKIVVFILLKIN